MLVTMDLPEAVLPNTTLKIPVKVESEDKNNKSFFTLALVDEGVLKLSNFKNANPEEFYYGQRNLNVELKDYKKKMRSMIRKMDNTIIPTLINMKTNSN